MKRPLLLSYAACGTCKKARKWLSERGIEVDVRAIVDDPPRPSELDAWLPASGLPASKWLNTSGASYRELGGKATFDGASDERIAAMLAGDGKLVKRPVLVDEVAGLVVLVGFSEAAYSAHFEPPATLRSGKAPSAASPKPVAPSGAAATAKKPAKNPAKKAASATPESPATPAKKPAKEPAKRVP